MAACGGTSAPATTTAASASPAAAKAGSPSATGAARAGGTLTVADTQEPVGFDYNYQGGARNVVENIYSHLVKPDLTNGEVRPDAATAWKTPNDSTWEFTLREGMKFHNDEPLDAAAVKATFDFLLSDKTPASSFNKIRLSMVKSVEAPDSKTVVFRTSSPEADLPSILYDHPLYPPKYYAEVGHDGFNAKPVGSGPFKFVSWQKGSNITLERFDGFYGDKAKIDRLVFRPIPEASARVAALVAGEVQAAVDVPPDDVPNLKGKGFQVATGPYGETWNLTFTPKPGSPFADVRVRQAVNYAIDLNGLVTGVLGGYGKAATQFVGPDAFGYNAKINGYSYNPEKAKALLAAAGYANGLSVDFDSGTTGTIKVTDVAQYIVAQLDKVGIKAKLNLMERGTFSTKNREGALAPMYLLGWFYWPQLDSMRGLSFVPPDKPFKRFYSSPELATLIGQAQATFDVEKRRALEEQANQKFVDEALVGFLYQDFGVVGLAKNVQGYTVTPDTIMHFAPVSLS
jgi:peptide/nickel transport system substrate-binding protein